MKCNYKKHLPKSPDAYAVTQETVKRIWEIQTLLTLRRNFGFGEKRLKQFVERLRENYHDVMKRAAATDKYDKKGRELTNVDAAEAEKRVMRLSKKEILFAAQQCFFERVEVTE